MIVDANELQDHATLQADVVIIGSGAAGFSLALDLIDSPLRVLMVESGGLEYDRNTQALYRGRITGLRYEPLDLCRVRIFGGSTDKRGWAGWSKVFSDIDFVERDWVALSGWPFRKSELDPYYTRALGNVYLPPNFEQRADADGRKADCLPLRGPDVLNDPVMLSTAPNLADTWADAIRTAKNVTAVVNAHVTQIETNPEGTQVTSVRAVTWSRKVLHFSGRTTVLAAGGIENVRLLLNSNETVQPGLGNQTGWVGRCFADHPRLAWGQITRIDNPVLLQRYNPTHGVGQRRMGVPPPGAEPLFGAGIAISEEAQRREKILGSRTWILPVSPQGERLGGRELREIVLWATRRRLPADLPLRVRNVLADIPNAASAVVAHLRSIAGRSTRWQFLTIMEPEPNPASRVMLDEDVDPLGMRRIKLDWRLTPLAAHSLERAQELIVRQMNALGVECHIEGPGGPRANQTVHDPRWVWHHMGTTRMSSDPTQGVVDTDGLVHGIGNLYVAGSSVFPTYSTDMPTLTVMALAHRLADRLRVRFGLSARTAVMERDPSPFEKATRATG
jgi:choline dehydrogenase-like flavoprotein